jgi:uncharacterized protein (DUF433 family)
MARVQEDTRIPMDGKGRWIRRTLPPSSAFARPMRSAIWHDVHRLHGEGLSTEAIAKAIGKPPYRVLRLLTESGALDRQYEYGIRDWRLLEDYREGLTQREICDRYHVAPSLLQKILRIHGEPIRPRKPALEPELVRAVVADYLDSDLTREEICEEHGITNAVLERILEEEDIPRRTPPVAGGRKGRWGF